MSAENLRIAILNDDLAPPTQSVARLARLEASWLAARGHHVALIGTVRRREEAGDDHLGGVHEIRIPTRYPPRFRNYFGLWNPPAVRAVERHLSELRPDVVHVHNCHTWLSYGVLRAARRFTGRLVLTAHDVMLFWGQKLAPYGAASTLEDVRNRRVDYRRSWRQRLMAERLRFLPGRNLAVRRQVSTHVRTVIAVSHTLKMALEQNGLSDVTTIHNPVDLAAMEVGPEVVEDFRARWRLGGGPTLLFGGRLSALKGVEPLLEAVAGLSDRHQPRLLIIGGGSTGFERRLDELVESHGLEDRVVRTGWLEGPQLGAAFAVADIVVNPSLCFETLGMMNLEAAAASTPVVSTFFGGAAETVVDGETGVLVNPFQLDQLADAIGRLLDSPELRRTMGRRGRRMVEERFPVDRAMEQLHSVLAGPGRE